MEDLLEHPFWNASDPKSMRLVRLYDLPSEANPFVADDVIMRIAASPGDVPYHKTPMARAGILDGIKKGHITPGTIVVEATSGNTGHAMASVCTILGLDFVAVVAGDVPSSKIDVIRALSEHVSIRNPEKGETTAACARRLGAQEGWYNPDQYSGEWNPQSHCDNLAPQLFKETPVSVFVTPGGTMGTCMGISQYVAENGLNTRVVPAVCQEGQEIPAARTLARVKKDVRLPWEKYFNEETDIQFGTRREAFSLSYLTWRMIPAQLGPSFGLALAGALKFLRAHKVAGTLDQFREPDGKIYVIVFGPDDYRPYNALYLGERLYDGSLEGADRNLLDLVGE